MVSRQIEDVHPTRIAAVIAAGRYLRADRRCVIERCAVVGNASQRDMWAIVSEPWPPPVSTPKPASDVIIAEAEQQAALVEISCTLARRSAPEESAAHLRRALEQVERARAGIARALETVDARHTRGKEL